jgi:hypothetical protein
MFVLSPEDIIATATPPEWSKITFLMNVGLVLSLPLTPEERTRLIHKLVHLTCIRRPGHLYFYLREQFGDHDIATILYHFDQICGRLCWSKRGWRIWIEQVLVRFMLRVPRISKSVDRVYRKLSGKSLVGFQAVPLHHRL